MKREYLYEALALGAFMVSAAVVTTVVEHPALPVRAFVDDSMLRRALIGLCMALTAVSIVYSPMGRRSGAHMNPAVTLTFWRLGKMDGGDAWSYMAAQFAGGCAGLAVAAMLGGAWLADPSVAYVATLPGPWGVTAAFAAELTISFGVMLLVLTASNNARLAPYTGLLVGCLIFTCITFEAPLSGMSMNPARTFAPMLVGGVTTPLWIYFLAPPIGMLAASEVYLRTHGLAAVRCAKLHHPDGRACIFHCAWPPPARGTSSATPASKPANAEITAGAR